MGADWYSIFCLYGYEITIPKDIYYHKYLLKVYDLDIDAPFTIKSIISDFHSRLEGASKYDIDGLNEYATIVLGFNPSSDLNKTVELANKLKDYITNNPILKNITFEEQPRFFYGKEWDYTYLMDYDNDEDDDSDDNSDF